MESICAEQVSEIPNNIARQYFQEIKRYFEGTYEVFELAGSTRRNKKFVGDIEIVTIDKDSKLKQKNLFDSLSLESYETFFNSKVS